MSNVTELNAPGLERIDDGVSNELREAIRTLVDAKYLVDELACTATGRRLVTSFHDGTTPRHGPEFFKTVLPFAQRHALEEGIGALVPTRQTIGASWRWSPDSVPENQRPELLAFLQDPARATKDACEHATFDWIKSLGLFVAHEGKNRVAFFREMHADWIPARVTPCSYPAANRLAIYQVDHNDTRRYWIVLDDTYVEPIAHPSWALPVLRAYGATEHEWPRDYPSVEVVSNALAARKPDEISRRLGPLDLNRVAEVNAFETEEVDTRLCDIECIKLPWRWLVLAGAINFISIILISVIPESWPNTRILMGVIAGTSIGSMGVFVLPVIRLSRRLADPLAVHREFGEYGRRRSNPDAWREAAKH
jgi:hypothetical protein